MISRVLLSLMLISSGTVYAKDLGIFGTTWGIAEEGFVAMMKRRLSEVDLETKKQELEDKVKKSFHNPKSGTIVSKAVETISYLKDPSYTVDSDILLPDGTVLYRAGHTINPLDHISLDKKLVFLDFNDEDSVKWADKLDFEHDVILVSGDMELAEEKLGDVYFDQFGEFTKKFGIKKFPAILEQENKMIKITEVKVDNE